MNNNTQEMRLLNYLKERKGMPVSRIELWEQLYIVDVPKVVSDLRKKGVSVRKAYEKPHNEYGKHNVAWYVYDAIEVQGQFEEVL